MVFDRLLQKKGIELTLNTVVIAILVIVVLVVLILIFGKYFGLQVNVLGGQIDQMECDTDNDGLKNAVDPCPCDPDKVPPCLDKNCNPACS